MNRSRRTGAHRHPTAAAFAARTAPIALTACLACAGAWAQQAPFTLDERFDTLLDRIEALEAEARSLEAERVSLRRDLAAGMEREGDLAERVGTAEDARDAAIAERDAAAAEAALELDRRETVSTDRDLAVDERDAASAERDALAAELEEVRAELDDERTGIEDVRAELDGARAGLEAARAELVDARAELADANSESAARAEELQAQLDTLIAERNAALADAAIERAKVEALTARAEAARGAAAAPEGSPTEAIALVRPDEAPRCADELSTSVVGVIASLVVTNPCRADDVLRVRAADPMDPLLAQLRAGFDGAGRASLRFPVLAAETRLRVFGSERGDFQDVVLAPAAGAAGTLAVLRWEDASVDLDLVVGAEGPEARTALGPRGDLESAAGRYPLAQGRETDQLPRFEVFVPDAGAAPLALGVDHASRGDRAEAPFCDDADAGAPRLLVTLRSGGTLQQIRDAFDPLPCGSEVPAEERGRVLRTLR